MEEPTIVEVLLLKGRVLVVFSDEKSALLEPNQIHPLAVNQETLLKLVAEKHSA